MGHTPRKIRWVRDLHDRVRKTFPGDIAPAVSMRPGDTSTSRYSVLVFVFTLHDPIEGGKAQQLWRDHLKRTTRKLTRDYVLQTVKFEDYRFNPEIGKEEQRVECTAYERSRRS